MRELVTRVRRGGGLDRFQNPLPADTSRVPLHPHAVEPGANDEYRDRGRNGETVKFTLYFVGAVNVQDDDRIEIRGEEYSVRVLDWRSPRTRRRGMVVLASNESG
ncbi:hypothetical protein [Rhodococcoides fascians]|uniref:hypothetical protein n=1 Tax=Rhodococcoides fascians TaxID=1828 RepID=UPI0005604444|nr:MULTISPECIES: hypothetical protein [Rhodococcus]OZC50522.1 hypothetical protein CH289_15970 [Rhodococcus sp. RS1C4]OZE98084.1 hypothetical protein CH301_17215 [Rhodococcus sp. 15-1189-1-1a]OZF12734.1 hypothetical protein CH299_17900 [Rhodococcus sp. 14-2686-1-2]